MKHKNKLFNLAHLIGWIISSIGILTVVLWLFPINFPDFGGLLLYFLIIFVPLTLIDIIKHFIKLQ